MDVTFNVFWDTQNLGPSVVSTIQSQHSNVKGALSLGGNTIIEQYNLHGIDINYEHFIKGYDTNVFSRNIGQLIIILKNNGVISFTFIAPYDTSDVQSNYMALWRDYGSVIDYINFQFNAYSISTTVTQFQNIV